MKTPQNSQNIFFPPSFEQYAFGMLILGRWYAVYTLSKSLLQIVCPVLWKCIQKMPPCRLTAAAHYQNLCMGNLEEEIIGEGGSLRGTYVNTKIWGGICPLTPPPIPPSLLMLVNDKILIIKVVYMVWGFREFLKKPQKNLKILTVF